MTEVLHTGTAGGYAERPSENKRDGETQLSFNDFASRNLPTIQRVVATEVHRANTEGITIDDVTQEVLVKLWKHFDGYDQHRKIEGWTTTVSRRIILDLIRMKNVRVSTTSLDAFESPEEGEGLIGSTSASQHPTIETERRRDYSLDFLTFAADALSATTNAFEILIAVNDGWSIKECAERFGEKEGTIKSRIYYAKKALRLRGGELIESSTADFSPSEKEASQRRI